MRPSKLTALPMVRPSSARRVAGWGLLMVLVGATLIPPPAQGGISEVCCQCDECNATPGLCFLPAPSDADCDTLCVESTTCQFSSTSTPGPCTTEPACDTDVVCCQCDECNAVPGLCFLEAPSDAECDARCQTAGCPFSSTSRPGVCVQDPSCGPAPGANPGAPLVSEAALALLAVALLAVGLAGQRHIRRPLG